MFELERFSQVPPLVGVVLLAVACNTSPYDISARNRTSPALRSFNSCSELQDELRQNLAEETRVQLLSQLDTVLHPRSFGIFGGVDVAMAEGAAPADSAGGKGNQSEARREGVDFSGTNNQEQGVDEADFVKTDGFYIYLINGNRLEIMGVPTFGELTAVSTTELEGRPSQMLIGDDKVVVFSTINTYSLPEAHPLRAVVGEETSDGAYGTSWWYRSDMTKMTVIDVTDRASPRINREIYLEGYYQTARRVDSTVRMVNYAYMNIKGVQTWPQMDDSVYSMEWGSGDYLAAYEQATYKTIAHNDEVIAATPLEDFLPQIYERLGSARFVEHTFTENDCRDFAISDDGMGRGVTSILSLDLLSKDFSFDHDHIITNQSVIYASPEVLLVAEPTNGWWWYWGNDQFLEATNIHRFHIGTAGETSYTGSARIDGTIRDQFSMSEHEGTIRVASTTGQWGRWWLDNPAEPENHVFCLAGATTPKLVGRIDGIAVGEQIWSSRFVGDAGYLTTFRYTDPLWTIDLKDPRRPTIQAALEVPGVSTYIHPLTGSDAGMLLTIGYGGDSGGLDWSSQVSLFDVSNPALPRLDAALPLAPPSPNDGWSGAWSEATWEHKAFQYWAPDHLLAIPLSTYRHGASGNNAGGSYEYYSRLQLIKVDPAGGLSLHGEIDHSDFFNSDPDRWWTARDVRRSIFMGDYVYAISNRGITANRTADLTLSASLPLTGEEEQPYWWW